MALWSMHLTNNGILDSDAIQEMNLLSSRYQMKNISHDDLARLTAGVYASHLKGCPQMNIMSQVSVFVELDSKNAFSLGSTAHFETPETLRWSHSN